IGALARRYGPGFAAPEFREPEAIVDWLATQRDAGRTCCVTTAASNAVRIARLATEQRMSLEGTKFLCSGEPLTEAKREIIERALPAEFGGGPGDFQLIEEEDGEGQTRLTLRIDPKLGAVNEVRLLASLRAELGRGAWGYEFQARVWDGAGTLRVRREAPSAS